MNSKAECLNTKNQSHPHSLACSMFLDRVFLKIIKMDFYASELNRRWKEYMFNNGKDPLSVWKHTNLSHPLGICLLFRIYLALETFCLLPVARGIFSTLWQNYCWVYSFDFISKNCLRFDCVTRPYLTVYRSDDVFQIARNRRHSALKHMVVVFVLCRFVSLIIRNVCALPVVWWSNTEGDMGIPRR